MRRLTILFLCCCLLGCQSGSVKKPVTFEDTQKQLFHEIDHKLVYQDCQELMRLHRGGKLSRTTFYADDPETIRNELPKAVRALRATYVRVDEVMVDINFHHGEDGTNLLRCFSNELGEPSSHPESIKGLGFCSDPYDMHELSGTESLEHLNKTYDHFQMELIPGLTYEKYASEHTERPEDIRQSNEMMDMMIRLTNETIRELAVKKQRLLYKTDHDALLKVCRQLVVRYDDGAFSTDKIDVGDDRVADDTKQLPEIIMNLEPVYVWFGENRVMVALIGGMDHAGVHAYANAEETVLDDEDMKLIDGLVYYDDGLREVGDDYRDYLKSLECEAVPYLDWKRKQMNLPIPKRK